MKVCESWLSTWTKPTITAEDVVHQFTMAGLEVDHFAPAAPYFSHVVVAEVIETKPHPQADKLTVCQVFNGEKTVQIVCGASNVRTGLKVALAQPGAELPNGMKIGEAKLRGEISLGMLCSAVELGCAESSDGIWELPKDAPVGEDFRNYLSLDDYVYEFDLTPNRGDCFSALGLARELAALTDTPFQHQVIDAIVPEHQEQLEVSVLAKEVCPLYCGRKIKNIRPYAVTPLWLKEDLRRAGLRTVHPVVDVLNYVMYMLGQPMHAFDCHKIGSRIEVRLAREGETIDLLNGKEVRLQAGTPLIANGERAIAIAGVMGSESSAVDDDTIDIFLESAFFAPIQMAGVARQYGLSTDASTRYERGVDPQLPVQALEFATKLLLEIVGGAPGPVEVIQHIEHLPQQKYVDFHPTLFAKRTGIELSYEDMRKFLERLHFPVEVREDLWKVTIPSYRFDINLDVDVVEEILRVFGYDNIPTVAIEAPLRSGHVDACEQKQQNWANALIHLGYNQAINYAFVDPRIQEMLYPGRQAIDLLNPISPELSQMRLGLWSGLIASLIQNTNRQQTAIQMFESGVVFSGQADNPFEQSHIAGLLYGDINAYNWCSAAKVFDFFDAKGHVEHLLAIEGYRNVKFIAKSHDALHPGQSASIMINDMHCGWVGLMHPRWQQALDLQHPIVLWELNVSGMPESQMCKYQPLSKFPQTRRDISFIVEKTIPVDEILQTIRVAAGSDLLQDVQVFDVYQGGEVSESQVSLAVACIFQDASKTMTEQDILSHQRAILEILKEKFNIKLRDGQ
jgi:phenylalanyl-tRNA synthetase beta chain